MLPDGTQSELSVNPVLARRSAAGGPASPVPEAPVPTERIEVALKQADEGQADHVDYVEHVDHGAAGHRPEPPKAREAAEAAEPAEAPADTTEDDAR
jgi:hypothetical protein